AANPDRPEPTEHAVATVTSGSVVTTGSAAAGAGPAEPLNTPSTHTFDESETPQKCRNEPTCQNGSGDAEVQPDVGVVMPSPGIGTESVRGDMPSLTPGLARPPFCPGAGDARALTRAAPTLSHGEMDYDRREQFEPED